MNRIDKKFKELGRKGKSAFVAFITAGYPNLKATKRLVLAFEEAGVDIIELGVPFSDPMSDGPVIQEASFCALNKNTQLKDIIRLVRSLRRNCKIPLLLMTYYNPVFSYGEDKFIKDCRSSGVDGVIIPDLSFEESIGLRRKSYSAGIHNIAFISPVTSKKRMEYIGRRAKGFIYYVALTGVTGMRKKMSPGLEKDVKFIKKITSTPVCVGFGVSNRVQVRRLCRVADGVIVGSAIVAKIKDNLGSPALINNVSGFVKGLR